MSHIIEVRLKRDDGTTTVISEADLATMVRLAEGEYQRARHQDISHSWRAAVRFLIAIQFLRGLFYILGHGDESAEGRGRLSKWSQETELPWVRLKEMIEDRYYERR